MHITLQNKDIKKMMVYLISTLILGILISGCTGNIEKGIPTYCEKHNCAYCEKDSDCTAIDFFEKMVCCQSRFDKYIAINVNSFNEITKLRDRWGMWHCFFRKCKQSIVSAPLSFPAIRCINNICTPFPSSPDEICTGNICTWNASWVKEQEEQIKRGEI